LVSGLVPPVDYSIPAACVVSEADVIFGKAAELLHKDAESLAHTMTLEMGKRIEGWPWWCRENLHTRRY
jgi:hypothetical protein